MAVSSSVPLARLCNPIAAAAAAVTFASFLVTRRAHIASISMPFLEGAPEGLRAGTDEFAEWYICEDGLLLKKPAKKVVKKVAKKVLKVKVINLKKALKKAVKKALKKAVKKVKKRVKMVKHQKDALNANVKLLKPLKMSK